MTFTLVPQKHTRLHETVLGHGYFILRSLADTYRPVDLVYAEFKSNFRVKGPSPEKFHLALCALYAMGAISINSRQEIRREA